LSTNGKTTPRLKTSKRQSQLRFEILNAFVDGGMTELSRSELATWLILYRDTKREGAARTSFDDIARRTGINRRTASRSIGALVRRKMIRVLRYGGLNRGPSTYRVFPYPME
jgi:CRP-like cAMP-binding protein